MWLVWNKKLNAQLLLLYVIFSIYDPVTIVILLPLTIRLKETEVVLRISRTDRLSQGSECTISGKAEVRKKPTRYILKAFGNSLGTLYKA